MAATLVPAVKTKTSSSEFITGLVTAWVKLYKQIPKKESIGVIYAQWAHETGMGGSYWNFNVGNSKYKPSVNPENDNDLLYTMLPSVWEMSNGVKTYYQPPSPVTWFRAFATLTDGLVYHLNFLQNKRYKSSWGAIEAGSPSQFAHLLKIAGYYTDVEENYSKGLTVYFNKFMKDATFETVIASLQPHLNVDQTTGDITITGDINLVPESDNSSIDIVNNTLDGLFGKNS